MSYQILRVTTFLLATKVITQCFRDISYPFWNKWSPWPSFVMHAHYKDKNTLIRHVCSANLYACIRFNVSFRLHMDGCVLDNLNKQMGNLATFTNVLLQNERSYKMTICLCVLELHQTSKHRKFVTTWYQFKGTHHVLL